MKRYTFTLEETELAAVRNVQEIFRSKHLILCTSCRCCTDGCPQHISIPDLFAIMNTKQLYHDWNADYYYSTAPSTPRPDERRPTVWNAANAKRSVRSTCPSASF